MNEVKRFLAETSEKILPRILTQICRDPGAPFYGSCDRNWWHYKIRDFPSIILQQAGYAVSIASKLERSQACASKQREIAASCAGFWNRRAVLHGAFEEYYPYEQGYPPLAFSTLAAAKLCKQGIVSLEEIRPGLSVAARQLVTRFEAQAANQQIAGTAALSLIRELDSTLVSEPAFQQILSKTLALQHQEGWFPEYDGPDLGYLSVSIDCLWDISDSTGDPRAKQAILKAAEYTAWFVLSPIGTAGMHNSRNTDYFVPYGLVRLAIENSPNGVRASEVVRKIFTRKQSGSFHPFDSVDDRYWSHYMGHSVFRALLLLENHGESLIPSAAPTASIPSCQHGSGHALLSTPGGAHALVSTRKGAITTAIWPDGAFASDFGWILQTSSKLFVSHWWCNDWSVRATEETASCEGFLASHREHVSTPWKHMVLRVGSFLIGRHLIAILKRLVIFKKPRRTHQFSRTVRWENETLVISDRISGVSANDRIQRAPRASKRHVASADSFHPEDLEIVNAVERNDRIKRDEQTFECETRYRNPRISTSA